MVWNIIIIPYVLTSPKLAVAKDMPITPYMTTGLRPEWSEANVEGTIRASNQRGYGSERHPYLTQGPEPRTRMQWFPNKILLAQVNRLFHSQVSSGL